MKSLKFIITLIIILYFQSCAKPVDFDQIDDAEIEANYILSQVYFNLKALDILDEYNNEIEFKIKPIEVSINNATQKYLDKIVFTVVTENSFDRAFNIEIVLLNEALKPIYTISPIINILPNSNETVVTIEIPNSEIDVIFNAGFFSFIVQLLPSNDGSVISINNTSELFFKSYVKLFFNYKTE